MKSIGVGHREVDVADDSQDWHDVRLLTCRRRLTDHYIGLRTPIDARREKLAHCEIAGHARCVVGQRSHADDCATMCCKMDVEELLKAVTSWTQTKLNSVGATNSIQQELRDPPLL